MEGAAGGGTMPLLKSPSPMHQRRPRTHSPPGGRERLPAPTRVQVQQGCHVGRGGHEAGLTAGGGGVDERVERAKHLAQPVGAVRVARQLADEAVVEAQVLVAQRQGAGGWARGWATAGAGAGRVHRRPCRRAGDPHLQRVQRGCLSCPRCCPRCAGVTPPGCGHGAHDRSSSATEPQAMHGARLCGD